LLHLKHKNTLEPLEIKHLSVNQKTGLLSCSLEKTENLFYITNNILVGKFMAESDNFVPILKEKELQEGMMKLIRVEGYPVLLIKQLGQIYVIDNRCPHMACSLSGGTLDGGVIVCPCHDWRFDLKTGAYEDNPSMRLTSYKWKIKSGKILVKFDEET
jgi:nitrite reductase/ring-hydroxylating ferredoxin subunit